jgi:hypothetical protein
LEDKEQFKSYNSFYVPPLLFFYSAQLFGLAIFGDMNGNNFAQFDIVKTTIHIVFVPRKVKAR